jgi:hypothetical protein
VEGDRITVSAQAAAVVKLFADGVLPAGNARAVRIEVSGREIGPCLLESVESGDRSAIDDMIVLHFRRAGEDGP